MAGPIQNTVDEGKGTDPSKTEKPIVSDVGKPKEGESAFDEKVFDDPRLWTHPRFKSLNERAKKADMLEKAQAEAEEKALAGSKKFEELANKVSQERDTIKSKYISQLQDNRIITEASKTGVVDIEAVLKLVDRTSIIVDDNGNVTGAIEAVNTLLTSKPFLKGKQSISIGSGSNPSADNNADIKKFKLSEISNPAFYREHEKEIAAAYKAGLIEDDMSH